MQKSNTEEVESSDQCTWCGIKSKDPTVRKRSRIIWTTCLIITIASILILFLVIIPVIIQDNVNHSDLEIIRASIGYPSNDSFQSVVIQKFTNAGAIKAHAQMRNLGIYWNNPEGGRIVTLTDSNSFTVDNNHVVTMRSTALVNDVDALTAFNLFLTQQPSFQWKIKGTADITFMVKARVNINKDVVLSGFNNFSVQPVVHFSNVTGGSGTHLNLNAQVTMVSNSNVEVVFGQSLMYKVFSDGLEVGYGELPNYTLSPGTTTSIANLTLTADSPSQVAQINLMLSNNSLGIPVNVTLAHFYNPNPVVWLAPSLDTIRQYVTLPPQKDKLTIQLTIYNQLIPVGIPYSLILYNPTDTTVTISRITGSVAFNGTTFATVDNTNLSIEIAPRSNVTTDQMTSTSVVSLAAIAAFNTLASQGTGYTDIQNLLFTRFGGFAAEINYHQEHVYTVVVPYI